jgi:hypothetical protein
VKLRIAAELEQDMEYAICKGIIHDSLKDAKSTLFTLK